jgi:hypothetical protein
VPDFLRRHGKQTDRRGRALRVFVAVDQAEELCADSTHQNRHRKPFIDEFIEALRVRPVADGLPACHGQLAGQRAADACG